MRIPLKHIQRWGEKIIPLYAEDLHFLIKRSGWLVTYIYEHYTFEQSKFQNDFVVMNQKSTQQTTSSVEKDFFKLLNNSNFGIDCRNNIDNCILEPLYDDLAEIFYIKIFTTIFSDDTFRNFSHQYTWERKLFKFFRQKHLPWTKMIRHMMQERDILKIR